MTIPVLKKFTYTTLGEYGITDAVTTNTVQTVTASKLFSGAIIFTGNSGVRSANPKWEYQTETSVRRWRAMYNATDATDGTFSFDKWNGSAWVTIANFDVAGSEFYIGANKVNHAGNTPVFDQGTYTPTLTGVANISSSSIPSDWQYMRVGNTVTVSGALVATVTAGIATTQLGISLPIASTLTASGQCAGTGVALGIQSLCGCARGDVANNRAELYWVNPANTTGRLWTVHFTYRIA